MVQIDGLRALPPQIVQLAAQVAEPVDLDLAPHRHGGERQHAVQHEIGVRLVMQVARPIRRGSVPVEIDQNHRVLDEQDRQHQQREAEEPAADALMLAAA